MPDPTDKTTDKNASASAPAAADPKPVALKGDDLPSSTADMRAVVVERDALKAKCAELETKNELLEEALAHFGKAKKAPRADLGTAFALMPINTGRLISKGEPLTDEECKGLSEGVHFERGRFA